MEPSIANPMHITSSALYSLCVGNNLINGCPPACTKLCRANQKASLDPYLHGQLPIAAAAVAKLHSDDSRMSRVHLDSVPVMETTISGR